MIDYYLNFGKKVFSEKIMREKLPFPIYTKWKAATNKCDALDRATADAIAHAMKEWAIELGATHYCHWFQPLSGLTAEKHDSFIDFNSSKETITRFSGKALIKGEPDASSFPSGGLRATFEARGYTYWDCLSCAFIRDNVLCIPTVFVSFSGQALDMKTPLLRSLDVISESATKIVNIFGDKEVKSVTPSIGLEQEYFLIDKKLYQKRRDLYTTGRTLIGNVPSKGQELEDHYFGAIPERVKAFMKEVDENLWELGIYAKTEHNEVAPCQFELAPIFSDVVNSVDQNLIIMDVLKSVADKHGLVCLLHEKPFNGVNGSGKHNNWSLITDNGQNLLDPGDNPHENVRFLIFMCAIIKAIDEHQGLIRLVCSNPGNDHRLGADEAPPAIVSIALGQQIEYILNHLENGKPERFEQSSLSTFSLSTLSYLPHDVSDRNRTSPVAFTGNKVEFRMLGSSLNASSLNTVLNTIVGDSLMDIAEQLENYKYAQETTEAAIDICRTIIKDHKRILFGGNGYSKEWIEESHKRGLENYRSFAEAIKCFEFEKTINLFNKFNILTKEELLAREEVLYENYVNVTTIEAKTLVNMIRQDVIPSFVKEINDSKCDYDIHYLKSKTKYLTLAIDALSDYCDEIENILFEMKKENIKVAAEICLNKITLLMKKIRSIVDEQEKYISRTNYPYPNYEDLFNSLD